VAAELLRAQDGVAAEGDDDAGGARRHAGRVAAPSARHMPRWLRQSANRGMTFSPTISMARMIWAWVVWPIWSMKIIWSIPVAARRSTCGHTVAALPPMAIPLARRSSFE